jgi:hypothetical protein
MPKILTISKLDAAKRQLETVIRMYFNSGDPVAMHTLAAAGHNVVNDINEKREKVPMLFNGAMLEYVKPEYHKAVHSKIHEAANFFKHADRDHDAQYDFNPDLTEFYIMDACNTYTVLTGELPPLFQIFRGWIMISHPNYFNFPTEFQQKVSSAQELLSEGRAGYFDLMLPVVMKRGV